MFGQSPRQRLAAIGAAVLVALLASCGAPTERSAGSADGVLCLSTARFDQADYQEFRVIDSSASNTQLARAYGESIGTAESTPCSPDVDAERWTAYRIPDVDPADGLIVATGEARVMVRADLADREQQWPVPLREFLDSHPSAADM